MKETATIQLYFPGDLSLERSRSSLSFLEMFKVRLDGAWSNMVYWEVLLPVTDDLLQHKPCCD